MSRIRILRVVLIHVSCLCIITSCDRRENENPVSSSAYLQLSQEERLLPAHAIESFETAKGVDVALFAAEPLLINPTNMDIDHRGRVWILESPDYGRAQKEDRQNIGRIVILEDTNHDGKADERTVYYSGEDVHIALGIAVLGNKTFVTRSPDLLIFTDENGDDIPDKKVKLFTGLGNAGDHSAHAVTFGPDGKLYWNMGNHAGPVKNAKGEVITEALGNQVVQYGDDYIGGMVLRCNPDGSQLEVLAHNFRNNYELAVDSYGTIWQSDNDDDGHESVRINYVMEYGNYGYLDEMTRESWFAHRTNAEEITSRRHWHQNDPGVVPNLLITGSGSPAGITIYEGNLLPTIFQNQMIHTDAGPNITRAYPVEKSGAGYTARMETLVKSKYDQWSRPIDVTTAPDGSVFIADWYDPIVGGGAAGEFERGRIFRVAPNVDEYRIRHLDTTEMVGTIDALKNANSATRYWAWTTLHRAGEKAESQLLPLLEHDNPRFSARALWLLGKIPGEESKYIHHALSMDNPDIRIVGLRMARQSTLNFLDVAEMAMYDPAPEVRREVAIGLHPFEGKKAAEIWVELALQYDGHDRWYLEALGIGAANNWDACLGLWLEKVGDAWNETAKRDIVWRSRSSLALPYIGDVIASDVIAGQDRSKFFRAFDFHKDGTKNQILLDLLDLKHSDANQIRALALQHLDPTKIKIDQKVRMALDRTLAELTGTREYLHLIEKYGLTSKKENLLKLIFSKSKLAPEAARLLLDPNTFDAEDQLLSLLRRDEQYALPVISAIESIGNKSSFHILTSAMLDSSQSLEIRKAAILGLGKTWSGEDALLNAVKDPRFDPALAEVAAGVLFNVYRVSIHSEASKHLPKPEFSGGNKLPTVRELVVSTGNPQRGRKVFDLFCKTCHQVQGEGIDFGPKLTEIGTKLSREGLYRAIMYPSEGINYGYEARLVTLRDGTRMMGIIIGESEEAIEIRIASGAKNRILQSEVQNIEDHPQSLMPNLSISMAKDQLVDLVEYLTTLGSGQVTM